MEDVGSVSTLFVRLVEGHAESVLNILVALTVDRNSKSPQRCGK